MNPNTPTPAERIAAQQLLAGISQQELTTAGSGNKIDLDSLYADESTRPIVHAMVAAIGYVHGQSVSNAAVMVATLKVGLSALEKLSGAHAARAQLINQLYARLSVAIEPNRPDGAA